MLSPAPIIDVHALMRGLVHELRNPLSAILTASSLLQSAADLDEESAMILGVVEKESRRMNRLWTEFSSFVKPPKAHPETFDIAKMLRELTRELQTEGTLGHHIQVRDELPIQLPVFCDLIQSQQAFQHLFANAAEAMQNGGTLCLHAESDENGVVILLDDSGGGFSHEVIGRVFQPFFSTKPAATGLGLSIANSLLHASGGEISLDNLNTQDPGSAHRGGARIRVHLPRSS